MGWLMPAGVVGGQKPDLYLMVSGKTNRASGCPQFRLISSVLPRFLALLPLGRGFYIYSVAARYSYMRN